MKKKWQFALATVLLTSSLIVQTADAASYTVQKGDTLSKIAKAHNTTIQQIKKWNQLKSDKIFIDQKLIVAKGNSNPTTDINEKNPVGQENHVTQEPNHGTVDVTSYKVQKGDTLTKIAKTFNVTLAQLKEWNKLNTDAIHIGQSLLIQQVDANNDEQNVFVGSDTEVERPFTEQEMVSAEEQIANQLAKEQVISHSPSENGQAQYGQVIALSQELIGTPYLYGGNTVAGFDCSGFVKFVYENANVPIMRKSSLQYFLQDTTIVQNPMPGDVVFFKNTYISSVSHMGIYIGNNEFIHAGTSGVEVSNITYPYWQDRFVAFKRFNAID